MRFNAKVVMTITAESKEDAMQLPAVVDRARAQIAPIAAQLGEPASVQVLVLVKPGRWA